MNWNSLQAAWLCVTLLSVVMSAGEAFCEELPGIPEGSAPVQTEPVAGVALNDEADLIRYRRACEQFKDRQGQDLSGKGLAVAIIDTGIMRQHTDFANTKIVSEVNLTGDNGGVGTDATDGSGHGTHVAGIIVADGQHSGMARNASLAIIKALHNQGEPVLAYPKDVNTRLDEALQWVLDHHAEHGISIVNMSLSDPVLRRTDNFAPGSIKMKIRSKIQALRSLRIPVIVAAGNHYRNGNRAERPSDRDVKSGMGFPAIIRETISVGAVYEADSRDGHLHSPYGEAKSYSFVQFQVAPFSARLAENISAELRTDIMAPGGILLPSTGIGTVTGSSHYEHGGTSQAAPIVTASVLLLQQYYKSHTGQLPLVDDLERWLRDGKFGQDGLPETILDGDNEYDNVRHTCGRFRVLDINGALTLANQQIQAQEP